MGVLVELFGHLLVGLLRVLLVLLVGMAGRLVRLLLALLAGKGDRARPQREDRCVQGGKVRYH